MGDVGHVQAVRRTSLEPPVHRIRPAARALGGFRRHRGSAAAHAPDAKLAHDVHHLVAADPGRIPALGDQLRVHLPVTVHGHEEIRVDPEDVAGRRPMPRPHAADGTCSEHAVAARREKPAVQRFGKDPADRPDLETAFMPVDVRGHQRRVGSSPAAKKPTPSSKSRSPDAIPRSRPAASSAPPSRPRPTASSPPRPSRPTGRANAAAIPAPSPDPSPPRRSRSSPTNTRNAIPPAA